MSRSFKLHTIASLLILPFAVLHADVRINEFMASAWDMQVSWDDGKVQPRIGARGAAWYEEDFNGDSWESGTAPFGFGNASVATDLNAAIRGKTPSLYLRKTFSISSSQAANNSELQLRMDYDDGFVAYLNGTEIARGNMGPPYGTTFCSQPSFNERFGSGTTSIDLGVASDVLKSGDNILCVQVHNHEISDADLFFEARLVIDSSPAAELVAAASTWAYLPGVVEPSGGYYDSTALSPIVVTSEWADHEFDDSAWRTSIGPIGIDTDTGDYVLGENLYSEIRYITGSIYQRTTFSATVGEAASTDPLEFTVDYDDAFVAYINGQEVARRNIGTPGVPPAHTAFADGNHNASFEGGAAAETISLGAASEFLNPGENTLAIQLHNGSITSSDMIIDSELNLNGTTLVSSTPIWSYFVGTSDPSGGLPVAVGDPEWTDWIELYNDEATPQPLLGWSLTDDEDLPQKWEFSDVTIPAHGFLMVYADGLESGLHTNFKLGADGEHLALFDASQTLVHQVAPGKYPNQYNNISYAIPPARSTFAYAETPTPGKANTGVFLSGKADKPKASPEPGIYDSALSVVLTTKTEGAQIRYTLDGTDPTSESSLYSGPVTLPDSGVSLRARAFKDDLLPSSIATGTYLINLPAALTQLPIIALSGDEPKSFYSPHGIFAINGGTYNSSWSATGPDDYNVPINRGIQWERMASLEILKPDTLDYFQKNLGCRLAASSGTRNKIILDRLNEDPWPPTDSRQKPSMNFYFRDEYDGKLNFDLFDSPVDSFERLRCRAGKNDIKNPFILDEMIRRIFIDMGQVGARGLFANLFLNGHYKGYYNLTERPREPFMQNWFNSDEDWDILHIYDWAAGDPSALYAMFSYLENNDLNVEANYIAASKLVDMENFADYLALNVYTATADWPYNNYTIARERTTDTENGKFRFFVWDAEGGFNAANIGNDYDTDMFTERLVSPAGGWIARLYQALQPSRHFRLLFADRLQKHFFNNGALTVNRMEPRFLEMQQMMAPVVEHVIGQSFNGSFFYDWTNNRESYLFDDCRQQQLWPVTSAPQFNQHGGSVAAGFELTITNPNASGSVYFTLDGTDPRAMDESIRGTLYQAPVALHKTTTVKARVKNGTEWSPLIEAEFAIESTANLILTEIMVDPPGNPALGLDGGEFEFIELRNLGAQTLELEGFAFTDGIEFTFDDSHSISAGGFLLLAKNTAAFSNRYPSVSCAGQYTGKFSNEGERITLSTPAGEELIGFVYNNSYPWPIGTDETGYALVAGSQGAAFDHSDPENWIAGSVSNGTPGRAEPIPEIATVIIHEIVAHTDLPQTDTIELYNPESSPADISHWYLTDDPDQPRKFTIPEHTIIAPRQVMLFDESDFNPNTNAPTSFAISSLGDTIYLFSGNSSGELTGFQDRAKIDASKNGETWGRSTLSTGESLFLPEKVDTLGSAANSGPRIGPVVISELLFAPTGDKVEFVELRNISTQTVTCYDTAHPGNTWEIEGIDFVFPQNTTLQPGEGILIAAYDPALFRQMHQLAAPVQVLGPYGGSLQMNGEIIRLTSPDTPDIDLVPRLYEDTIKYSNTTPWPQITAVSGRSLERVRLDLCAMDPAAWRASDQPGGTPGSFPDLSRWADWEQAYFSAAQLQDMGISGLEADPDHDGYVNLMEFALTGDPIQADQGLITLEFVMVNGINYPAVRYTSFANLDATIEVESSTNLVDWAQDMQSHVAPVFHSDGTVSYWLRDITSVSEPPARFLRVKVSTTP